MPCYAYNWYQLVHTVIPVHALDLTGLIGDEHLELVEVAVQEIIVPTRLILQVWVDLHRS